MKSFPTDFFPLEYYGYNLTNGARQGLISPLRGYEAVIERIFQVLLRQTPKRYNPLLLDLDESRQWQVINEVVRRMALGEAPDPLPTRQVIALNYETLLATDSLVNHSFEKAQRSLWYDQQREETELSENDRLDKMFQWPTLEDWSAPTVVLARLQALFLAVRQTHGQVLLCLPHFDRLLGRESGEEKQQHQIDAYSLLKPTLARREIQLMGTCAPAQYRQYIERNAAIACRLQEICLRSDEELQRI